MLYLDNPHVGHGCRLQLAVSTERAGQQGRRRGRDVGLRPPALLPEPGLDVQESVGDVEPGVEQADVVTAGRLECQGEEVRNVLHSELSEDTHSSQTMQKLLFPTQAL